MFDLVPKLRFKEFHNTGDWENKRLNELGVIVTGNTPKTNDRTNYGNSELFVTPVDISAERYVIFTKTMLSEKGFGVTRHIDINSILFVCIGSTIGKIAQNKSKCSTNQQINSIVPYDEYSNDFIYSLLEKNSSNIANIAGHQAVPLINKSDFSAIKVQVPSMFREQQKIADCLSSLDNLITAHNQKHEALKAHKKGLMQKLFPQEGEKIPKLRFKEFNDDWEEKQLINLISTVTPTKKLLSENYLTEGLYPIIDQSQNYICGWTNDKKSVIVDFLPLIVFGGHTCALKFVTKPFAQGADGIKILKTNDLVESQYLYQFLRFNPLVMDGYKRHFSSLKEKQIVFPRKKTGEQQKIANCLSAVDNLISTQAEKITTLKAHKKGLIQQLFVSN
jgi:type I restriction enzyme S subunit